MRTIAASGLIALTAMHGVKAPPPANQLYGVSCPSSTYCVAVGINENAEVNGGGALIQTWNGTTWTSVEPKAPKRALSTELLGVSCATAKSCVAVGLSLTSGGVGVPLAETWNGRTWAAGTPARPAGSTGGQLDNVSCPTAKSCVAVGSYSTNAGSAALAESWNGSRWTISRPPEPKGRVTGELIKVSCPSARYCVAVGTSSTKTADFALAESWNGTSWARMTVAPPTSDTYGSTLTGVSCPSATNCVAVGFADANFDAGGHTGRAAATAWNGKTWTATTVPAPAKGKASLFNEVSCPAAAACVAVGQLGPYNSDEGSGLAGFWNAKTWKLATTPS